MDVIHLVDVMALLTLIWVTALYRLSPLRWTILSVITLILITRFGQLSPASLAVLWMIEGAVLVLTHARPLRMRFMQAFVNRLQLAIPHISTTEREAIEAGDVWWEKELFCGNPHWQKLFDTPKPTLSAEEQAFLDHQTEELCSMLSDWEIVHQRKDLPEPVWAYLKQEKFFGLILPKAFGGLGFSALALSSIVLKVATRSISAAVTVMVPNTLGPGELLLQYGTDDQKNYYLPRLANGTEIPCFALTGPEAGSDASAIPDTGIVCVEEYEGKPTLGIRLTWDKRYITLAPVATVLGLAVRLYDPEHHLGETEDLGITVCLIPTSRPGVEIGHRHFPMQLAFMNGPTRGKNVFVPIDSIIGGKTQAGKGWKMLMACLAGGRATALPALAAATGQAAYRFTGAYARLRKQFKLPISSFEGVEEALGYIAGYAYLLEACRTMTVGVLDQHVKPAIASAISKFHMTELSRLSMQHAMDIHGGHAIQAGPRNFLALIHTSIPISITVEGANILTRNLIIFGQGAIRCHPYLLQEMNLLTSKQPDLARFDQLLMSHAGYFLSNLIKNIGYGLTGGRFIFSSAIKRPTIKRYQRQLIRMSAALALVSDLSLMTLGGKLKRKERLSARLGDVLSQLYLASAVLKYYRDRQEPVEELEYVMWCLQLCLAKIQVAMDEFLQNFPSRFLGKILRWILFPYGRAYAMPQDKLHAKLVPPMLSASSFRKHLTQYCYVSKENSDWSARLERGLQQIEQMEGLWKKISQHASKATLKLHRDTASRIQAAREEGVLTDQEAQALTEFEALRQEIIKVNEFSFDLDHVIA
jgi:alkylation response protein AidB-like acyl-CoA dehydrogenase